MLQRFWLPGAILCSIMGQSLPGAAPSVAPVCLEEIAARAGVNFVLRNSATPAKFMIETMIAGVAVFDYNNDGRPDIYFVNGARHPDLVKPDPSYYNRLFRNEGHLKFTDVTLEAGVPGKGYAMGVATADYDNDGDIDIFVVGVNHDVLYQNRGDGTFADVTAEAGLSGVNEQGEKHWSVATAWLDYDNDGWLDLFVVNYLVWSYDKEIFCGNSSKGYRAYCHPKYYAGLPNSLYRNNGDGTFTNVSGVSGIGRHVGKGMAIAVADYNLDSYPDVFVTNDTLPNFLFRNEGDGRFSEVALEAGVAFNDDGRTLSSMGADFRDFDNDGRPDLFITALTNETFPLFRNIGDGLFQDITYTSLLGTLTLDRGGWGCGFYDFNNDGFKDLFLANGDVQNNVEMYSSRKTLQPNQLLLNRGDRTFEHSAADAASFLKSLGQHRGAAFGDLDGDGLIDAVVTRLQDKAEIWHNTSNNGNHWLALRLEGAKSNRGGIGTRVHVATSGGLEQWNHVTTSHGYGSSSDKTLYFGLGAASAARLIEVYWPSGIVERLEDVSADRYLTVRER